MSARTDARLLGAAFSGGYGGGYPFGGRSNLVDLIMARGMQQAEATRAQGQMLGDAFKSIGDTVGGAIEKERLRKQDEAALQALSDWDGRDPKALYTSLKMYDPQKRMEMMNTAVALRDLSDKATERDRANFNTVLRGAASLPYPMFQRAYPFMHGKMAAGAQQFLGVPADSIPGEATPETYQAVRQLAGVKSNLTEVSPGATLYNPDTKQAEYTAPTPVKPDKGPEVGSFGDYLTRTYGEKPTPQQIIAARKAYGQADDRARVTVMNMGGDYQLSDQGIDIAALNYRKTGTLPPIARDPAALKRIVDRAATLTPNDVSRIESGGMDVATNKAAYGADAGSLKKLQQQTDAVAAFESTATANSKVLDDMVKRIPDLGAKFLNTPARALAGQLGSEDMAAFNTIRQSVANEYARIISNPSLAGTMSDSARHEADVLLDPNATVGQIRSALRTLHTEAANRRQSYQDQLGQIRSRMSGGNRGGAPAAGPARPKSKAEMDALPSGTPFIAPDGTHWIKP